MFRKKQANRIKISHATGWLHFGGEENGIVNLINSLDPDVFENYTFTFVAGNESCRIQPGNNSEQLCEALRRAVPAPFQSYGTATKQAGRRPPRWCGLFTTSHPLE